MMESSRLRQLEAWVFVGASLLLTALYACNQLVPPLGFVGQVLLHLFGRLGIMLPAIPG